MSTPSTATITVPPAHHLYKHSSRYLPDINTYPQSPASFASNRDQRAMNPQYPPPTPTYHATQQASSSRIAPTQPPARQSNSQASSQYHDAVAAVPQSATSTSSKKRGREEPVDWERYFGGRPPKEIIVIDDDSPQPNAADTTQGVLLDQRHIDKRRKTANNAAVYDPVYSAGSHSNTQTPYLDEYSRPYTGSTDRTGNYPSTAATSLGSTSSGGTYIEEASIGQKRKRAIRQPPVDIKRRGPGTTGDPFAEYIPPPYPPIKAKDVHVAVIQDRTTIGNAKVDDEEGHYVVVENADLTERYSILKLLGQGTFGKVVKAYDRHRRKEVAVKIIRSVQKYRDASRIELRVLATLAHNDKLNRNKCIHLRDTFDYKNHICIVTDLLGQSVFDFLKGNQFVPFPSSHIQRFSRQLFTSVAFLHDLNLVHTDLKPENILLVNSQYQTFTYSRNIPSSSTTTHRSAKFRKVLLDPEIRLIDFGSATFEDEYHSSVVSTRHYRAPEIILNLGWSLPCDIWSIGCILVEFFTGDALFQTHDNLEHLAMMEAVCDKSIDKDLIRKVTSARGSNKNSAAAFFKRQVLDYPRHDTPRSSRKFVKAMKKLHEIIPNHTEFNRQFLDLLQRIFIYDPKMRITAKEALQHPWFKEHLEDDGTEAEKIRVERERQAQLERVEKYQRLGRPEAV